ncbi:MAG: exodeoxyribonuclease VII large subunit [Candidatus Saccharimonas sp.]
MARDQTPIFSVSDFVASLNQTLEYAYPIVEIEGEVASFKVNQGKWVFFDLKDQASSVGCFMSLYSLRVPVEDGMKVVVRAAAKLTPWGKFSLTVQSIRPSGEGSLKKSFELLKAKLDKEGLFALERKRTLPEVPSHIAVISSTQAAGYADFIKILEERWVGLKVDVAHVQVQGTSAPEQIIRAINYFNEQEILPEVLVIIRGGGSADDLAAFNDEPLVREIAGSRIPTLVGVGHEVDMTLADMVADRRAATPSNAAQIVVPDKRELAADLRHMIARVLSRMESIVESYVRETSDKLHQGWSLLDMRVDLLLGQLVTTRQVLGAYDPRAVLERGYAIVRGVVSPGQEITIERKQQLITAEVVDVKDR